MSVFFPKDIWRCIFIHLDINTLLSVGCVCKDFCGIVNDDDRTWRRMNNLFTQNLQTMVYFTDTKKHFILLRKLSKNFDFIRVECDSVFIGFLLNCFLPFPKIHVRTINSFHIFAHFQNIIISKRSCTISVDEPPYSLTKEYLENYLKQILSSISYC